MKLGVLTDCFKELIQHWRVVVQLGWIWFGIFLAIQFWWNWTIFNGLIFPTTIFGSDAGIFILHKMVLSIVVPVIIFIVGYISIAIGWHRFILLDELPSKHQIAGSNYPILGYFLVGFQISVLIILLWLPAAIILPLIFFSISSSLIGPSQLSAVLGFLIYLVTLAINIILSWIALRLSLRLPAIAIGVDMTMKESFALTRPLQWELLITAIALAAITYMSSLTYIVKDSTEQQFNIVELFALSFMQTLSYGLSFMVGVGVLTSSFSLLRRGSTTDN